MKFNELENDWVILASLTIRVLYILLAEDICFETLVMFPKLFHVGVSH
jgi:hypothetical protein